MKTVLVLLITFSINIAVASQFRCTDLNSGNASYLQINGRTLSWSEKFHAASSAGSKIGIETALYSDWRGYHLFRLNDFYRTEDSSYILAISPRVLNGEAGDVFIYFDNDDHPEEATRYICTLDRHPPYPLFISQEILDNQSIPFLEHIGSPDNPWGTTLAMNIQYEPVKALKAQIEGHLGSQLKFFTGFIAEGEAHITTVTPVEYHNILRPFVAPERMSEIARRFEIQSSDLEILALGRGQAVLNGKNEDTYFIIVRSENLLRIRHAIYQEFVRAGGNPDAWNPDHFFPHITIGYTARDLHENDGVLKDLERSLDPRFDLSL